MDRVLLFNFLQIAATFYALVRGGAPERIVGSALLAAALSTYLVFSALAVRFGAVELSVLAVDVLLLAILVIVALHADRYWTLWVAVLQLLGTGAHLAEAVSPDTTKLAYAILSAAWAYPIVFLLIVGTLRHTRRLKAKGWDLDWSRHDPTLS